VSGAKTAAVASKPNFQVRGFRLGWSLLPAVAALPFLLAGPAGHAGQLRAIDLVDGSVVVGEILSVDSGKFRVRTERLGVLTLDDADIAAIRAPDAPPATAGPTPPAAPAAPSGPAGSAAAIQQQILGNPEALRSIEALKDDPELQQILKDPALMKSIAEGNVEAVQSDPRIQRLLANPTIQGIQRLIAPAGTASP
jgi:hypothetical protein